MTHHKTVLLEGQARDDAAEIERLRHEVAEAHGVAQACEQRAERAEAELDALLTAMQSARDFVCIHEGELIGTVYLQLVHDMNAVIDAARQPERPVPYASFMDAFDAARGK